MTEPTPSIVLAAPAKLTVSLRVTGLRDDGLHLVDAEMVTVDLHDTLELIEGGTGLTVVGGGEDVPTGPDNLVARALALAGRVASIRLTKRIPSEAGLGGGSSDAGAVLRWAGFDDLTAAAGLGADVAFCTIGGRARVSGIGEVVEPLPHLDRTYTLFTPPVACPTGPIYRRWDEMGGPEGDNGNDLEPAALSALPELAGWRDRFADAVGQRPRLAGSGSTWFVEGAHAGDGRVVVTTVPADYEPNRSSTIGVDGSQGYKNQTGARRARSCHRPSEGPGASTSCCGAERGCA